MTALPCNDIVEEKSLKHSDYMLKTDGINGIWGNKWMWGGKSTMLSVSQMQRKQLENAGMF